VSAPAAYAGRRRRLVGLLGAILLGGAIAAPASGAAPSLQLSEGGGAKFPARSLVLSLPGKSSLSPAQVHVSDNGRPVQGAVVRPVAKAAAGDFGIVLAIDASPSMRGAPLARAMAAARALAAQRSGMQELSVVTFDQTATVALPLTDDSQAIARALAHTPEVGRGAYLYNALTVAVQQLANAKIAAGAVILLSDGASQGAIPTAGHNVTASAIGEAAASANARIYTVGLRDGSYTPQRMSLLAKVGGGAFVESSSAQLAEVFTRIEAGLTKAYVIHYRSLASLGHRVTVSVSVDGIAEPATLTYTSPAPPRALGAPRPHRKSFWLSTAALVLSACIAALMVGLAALALLGPRFRHSGVRRRVREFTTGVIPASMSPSHAAISTPLSAVERALERTRWWPRFKEEVEIARIQRTALELLSFTALGTIVAAVLVGLASGTPVPSLLLVVFAPMALPAFVKFRVRKQRQLFAEQLPTHLQELASAMRAGHSLVSGFASIAQGAPEPSRGEWSRVVGDEQLGQPLEEAMQPLARRMDTADVEQVALVAALHQRTGGNMAEVLERVAESVRERAELRRELHALTAQARLSRVVVTLLPVVLVLAIYVINPRYLRPLFHTSTGVVLLFLAGGMLVVASLIMRRIVEIKV
jgi:tight adherence protein B